MSFVLLEANQFLIIAEVCFGSLSCWKTRSIMANDPIWFATQLIFGSKLEIIIFRNYSAFILPMKQSISPTPNQDMNPYIIALPPQNVSFSLNIPAPSSWGSSPWEYLILSTFFWFILVSFFQKKKLCQIFEFPVLVF